MRKLLSGFFALALLTGVAAGCTDSNQGRPVGESPSERSEPDQVRRISNWPDFNAAGRPRSATVVISRNDGGVIGA